jgi:hypothetical protein
MITIGNPNVFAIESAITKAYESLGMQALGYFVLHVGSKRYGVREPEASMLGCSIDAVDRRLENRGKHAAFFSQHGSGGDIADAVYGAIYASPKLSYPTFGRSRAEVYDEVISNKILWAPDGDEAFDDVSFVLHFDLGDKVRVIAFRLDANARHDPATLSDVTLRADYFYELLRQWRSSFEAEWRAAPKILEI